MVNVVAALILKTVRGKTQMLICRRPANKARALLWEFPGGKVEPGEGEREALFRECREELDVSIAIGSSYAALTHEYPDLTIQLTLFVAILPPNEEPKAIEHSELRWITAGEIPQFQFCPADKTILEKMKKEGLPQLSALQAQLLSMQDLTYRKFFLPLVPTVDQETIIGVRTPQLRAFAKALAGTPQASGFLQALPHRLYEENNLHAFLIERLGDFRQTVTALDAFLPYVNNWATCDSLFPKCFKKHHAELRKEIDRWLDSPHTYTVRFAMKTLMTEYLGDDFSPDDPARLAAFQTDEYYLQMMIAWYFATALAKRFDDILPYFRAGVLDPTVRKMAIRKAKDSYRLTKEQKEILNRI